MHYRVTAIIGWLHNAINNARLPPTPAPRVQTQPKPRVVPAVCQRARTETQRQQLTYLTQVKFEIFKNLKLGTRNKK